MKVSMKKATKVALATALLTSAFATTVSADMPEFTDVPETNVHYDNIYNLAGRGVVSGYPDGTYQPARHLTRAEAAVILTNALGLDTSEAADPGFPDVKKGAYYFDEVAALVEYGVISGYDNGNFGPNDKLTRAQMAVLLSMAYNLYTLEEKETPFKDVKPGSWYDAYVQNLYFFGVTSGISATKYGPNDFVRRDAMASFVVNAEEVPEEAKYEEWLPLYLEVFNSEGDKTLQAGWDSETNTIMVGIADTAKTADFLNTSGTFFSLIPFYDFYSAKVKGSDYELTMGERELAEQEIFNALGVDKTADLNDVEGKQVTFVLEGYDGSTFEYTITFANQTP